MALGLFIMFIGLIFLVFVALFITGIVFIVIGAENKKRGGKGTKRIIGIVMVAIPLFLSVLTPKNRGGVRPFYLKNLAQYI